MAHIHKNQQALLTRVKKIRGQLNAVEKSMNDGNECLAILQQVTAIKGTASLCASVGPYVKTTWSFAALCICSFDQLF